MVSVETQVTSTSKSLRPKKLKQPKLKKKLTSTQQLSIIYEDLNDSKLEPTLTAKQSQPSLTPKEAIRDKILNYLMRDEHKAFIVKPKTQEPEPKSSVS